MGERLERNIGTYVAKALSQRGMLGTTVLSLSALAWLRRLPQRFQAEIEGLAEGAGLPLQRLAEWCYVEEYMAGRCTSLIGKLDGRLWVARNNDYLALDLWGFATARKVDGLIPTLSLGMEGEPFTVTGINAERLWLHYHYLPVRDEAPAGPAALPTYVWLTSALETCRSLADVEAMLDGVPRTDAMMLFALDVNSQQAAIFECDRACYTRIEPVDGWLVGTNHRRGQASDDSQSVSRYDRALTLTSEVAGSRGSGVVPALRRVLGDAAVEQRGEVTGTVYSAIACPSSGELWYTFGGYPAASHGRWGRIPWPWY
jgi:hypothetical protein